MLTAPVAQPPTECCFALGCTSLCVARRSKRQSRHRHDAEFTSPPPARGQLLGFIVSVTCPHRLRSGSGAWLTTLCLLHVQAAANAAAQASAAGESAKEVTAKAKAAAKDAAAQAQATTQDTAGKAQAKSEGVWQKVRCYHAALPAICKAGSVKAHDVRISIRRLDRPLQCQGRLGAAMLGLQRDSCSSHGDRLRQAPVAITVDAARHQLPSRAWTPAASEQLQLKACTRPLRRCSDHAVDWQLAPFTFSARDVKSNSPS